MARLCIRPLNDEDRAERERLLSGRVAFSLADLPSCVAQRCRSGREPCPGGCGVEAGANDGTLDVRLLQAAGLSTVDTASAPDSALAEAINDAQPDFRRGYVAGHRAGLRNALLVGVCIGVSLVGAALQAGWWVGGLR